MTLDEYLTQTGTRLVDFARELGKARSLVHDWKSGRRFPNGRNLVAIERATGGRVQARDFVPASEREAA